MIELVGIAAIQLMVVNFCYIGMRAFQTRNVQYGNWVALWVTGLFLAWSEAYTVDVVAELGPSFPVVLALWIGGTSGAHIAVLLHRKIYKKAE